MHLVSLHQEISHKAPNNCLQLTACLRLAATEASRYVPAGNEMDRKERQFSEFPGYRKYRHVSQEVYSGDGGNVLMSPLRLDVSFRLPVHLIVRWLLRLRTG